MSNPLRLVRLALADSEFTGLASEPTHQNTHFELFRATLEGRRYTGLPRHWHFAVLRSSAAQVEATQVRASAEEILRVALSRQCVPVVLVSDHRTVQFDSDLRFDRQPAFVLDEAHLTASHGATDLRIAPFIRAVRRKSSVSEILASEFSPYRPKVPAVDWRFYGRQGELQQLVGSDANYFVVGARQVGKTSLLREVGRLLREKGYEVHYVPVQHLSQSEQLVAEIIKKLSARDAASAVRRSQLLNEDLLDSVIRNMRREGRRAVLILDEFGNLIFRSRRKDDWRLVGQLREFSHGGQLRVIMSGFQEFFYKQHTEYGGPFVNFARELQLQGITRDELDHFLIGPLSLWGRVRDKVQFTRLVSEIVGNHPLLLTYLGHALYSGLLQTPEADVGMLAARLLQGEGIRQFSEAVEEIFFRDDSFAERVIYLRRCRLADNAGEPVESAVVTDPWVKAVLQEHGCDSTFDGRRMMLQSMEMKGLLCRDGVSGTRYRISTPFIYQYLKLLDEDVDALTQALASDIHHEAHRLMLGTQAPVA